MPESLFNAPYLCMHRGDLHEALASVLPADIIHRGKKLVGLDERGGRVTLTFEGGELIVPRLEVSIGERVRARIRARDVSLSVQRPTEVSILNILPGRVTLIDDETGPVVDVQLAVGSATFTSRITRRSFQQLGIHSGQELYALIKAVSFDQRSVGYA